MSPRRSLRMWVWFLSAAILPVVALAQPPAAEVIAAPAEAKPADLDTPEGRLGYALGLRIGSRIAADFKTQNAPLDAAALARGLADAVLGIQPRLDEKKIAAALEGFEARMREQEREFAKRMAEVAKVNKAKAAEFLKANAAKQGVITLPSGLQYEILEAGRGPSPKPDDTVATHYRGTHLDGKEFDATDPKGEPATFPISGVVPGWQEALPLMKVGAKWRLYVPPELGYGEEGSPPVIEPNEVLVFEIELVKIGGR
ncbi:MAG: FKBP-type peptidyl-prolyl cis-trans isomerase [Planctomycetia bacterium]|jgi:FKBP-type peptidyl-prolyl cis-trans isomerase FklB